MTTKLLINVHLLRWCYNLIIEHRGKHREERRCHSTPGTRAGSICDIVEMVERAKSAPNTPPPSSRRSRPRAPSIGQTPIFANSELELTAMNENILVPEQSAAESKTDYHGQRHTASLPDSTTADPFGLS